jgi:hypothetical protein
LAMLAAIRRPSSRVSKFAAALENLLLLALSGTNVAPRIGGRLLVGQLADGRVIGFIDSLLSIDFFLSSWWGQRHAQSRPGVRIRLGASAARDQEDDRARADESPQHCLLQAIRSPLFGFAEYRCSILAQQRRQLRLRQLRYVHRNAPSLVPVHEIGRRAPTGFLLVIDVSQAVVFNLMNPAGTGRRLFCRPWQARLDGRGNATPEHGAS